MSKKKDNPIYVTRAECARISSEVREDLEILKTALVGKDLRGGIVADISAVKAQVEELAKVQADMVAKEREKRETYLRWKIAAFSFLATIIGIIIKSLL